MPAPIASWNPERDVWESAEMDLFSGLSAVYSETFPVSGTTRAGMAYARPTSAPLTDGSASSSPPGLLPTPDAYEATRGGSQHPDRRKAGGHSICLQDVAEHMLPTPQARDWKGVGPADHDRNDPGLPAVVETLLPTPKATDGTKGGPNQRGSSGDLTLPSAAMTLLPTPTAVPYGNNQSPSPGASVRPSLDTLAPMLLPTPTAMDSRGSRQSTAPNPRADADTLTDWAWKREGWTGANTDQPSDDGNAA